MYFSMASVSLKQKGPKNLYIFISRIHKELSKCRKKLNQFKKRAKYLNTHFAKYELKMAK